MISENDRFHAPQDGHTSYPDSSSSRPGGIFSLSTKWHWEKAAFSWVFLRVFESPGPLFIAGQHVEQPISTQPCLLAGSPERKPGFPWLSAYIPFTYILSWTYLSHKLLDR